ncbi:OmpA family protein [Ferrovibrio sp.]|uniref:OmpA family protein n=1 Tax=Ferrovibrio sp. TaxID=1917215 RepID=UPI0026060BE0|nr:OmpA family protein [Ferrovibrio sp.]
MKPVSRIATTCVAATALSLAGCASRNGAVSEAPECSVGEPAYIVGATILGALAGAMLAGKNNRGQGAVIGAAAGGAIGATASHFIKQRCQKIEEAKKRLYGVDLAAKEIEVKSAGIDWRTQPDQTTSDKKIDEGIATIIHSKSMFDVGSAEMSRATENDMRTIAGAYAGTNNKVLIVGHTDNSGGAEQNLALSERRAKAVANVFANAGIPRSNIYYKGAGETRPIGDNTTEEGRALNRRVEVVELQTESGVIAYEAKQDANINYMQRAAKSQIARTTVTVAPLPSPTAANVKSAPSSQPQHQKPAEANVEYAVALKPGTGIDFGGQPVNGKGVAVASAVGDRARSSSTFSFVSRAFASSETAYTETSCLSDPNQKVGIMRSLATGEEVSRRTSAYMPGLYGTSWTQNLNGHLAGLSGVKVLRDGARVEEPPQMIVFKDYKPGDQVPTIKTPANARGFEGESGILYRVFMAEDAWPVRCMDLVFDTSAPGKTKFGRLYYDKGGIVHVADFAPTIPSDK